MSAIHALRVDAGVDDLRCRSCGRKLWIPGTPAGERPEGAVQRKAGGQCWTCAYGGKTSMRARHQFFPSIIRMRDAGFSDARIAARLGVTERSVQRWRKEIDDGWTPQDRPYYLERRYANGEIGRPV